MVFTDANIAKQAGRNNITNVIKVGVLPGGAKGLLNTKMNHKMILVIPEIIPNKIPNLRMTHQLLMLNTSLLNIYSDKSFNIQEKS